MNRQKRDPLDPVFASCGTSWRLILGLLEAGDLGDSFRQTITFAGDSDRELLTSIGDVNAWLETTGRAELQVRALRRIHFPALTSDFLHFVDHSLRAARDRAPTVAWALVRKPLQEVLGVMELMAVEPEGYVAKIASDPKQLHMPRVGGTEAHIARIEAVLRMTDCTDLFDAEFIARARYDKHFTDGLAADADRAMHLFTDHKAITTPRYRVNLVLAEPDEQEVQIQHLLGLSFYLLEYSRRVFTHVFERFEHRTHPDFTPDVDRRALAAAIVAVRAWDRESVPPAFVRLHDAAAARLDASCALAGGRAPKTMEEVRALAQSGDVPGESATQRLARRLLHAQTNAVYGISKRLGLRFKADDKSAE